MESPQFIGQYKRLNRGQKEAVDTIEGPVMVIAGPGTGKTQVLTLRIANILLKTQVNPENILALTFSESASFQMRQRLLDIIGTSAYRVEISTFHSFANSVIQNNPVEFENLISSESILEEEQVQLLEKIVDSEDLDLLRPWGDHYFYVRDVLSAINDLKKEGIDSEKLSDAIKIQKEDLKNKPDLYHGKGRYKGLMKSEYAREFKNIEKIAEFIKIFKAYQSFLLKNKKYDFNDMLIETVKVLESNRELRLLYQEKFQYFLVDEHQDTNASQNRLVELLASFYEVPNLFVVGDEKQAIYRFQGASLENFLYFQKKYPDAKLINLNVNYRSPQIILDASVSFISKNISANVLTESLTLISDEGNRGERIKIIPVDDYYGEFEYVAQTIEGLIQKGVDPREIAVLSRRNFELSELATFLKRKNIPHTVDADLDILSDLWIGKFLLILKSVAYFPDEESFCKALTIDVLGVDPMDIYKLVSGARKMKINTFDFLEKSKRDISYKKITKFFNLFKGWVTLSKNIQFDDLFVKVLGESGIREGFLSSPDRNEVLNKFIRLFESVKEKIYKNPEYSITDFLTKLEMVKKHNLTIKAKSEASRQNGVRLLTAHKAKGLEFEYIFIIQCIEGRWGSIRKKGQNLKIPWQYMGEKVKADVQFDAIEDERRLFFVGLTRAKKNVFLTYSRFSQESKEQLPSQFLEEINPDLVEVVDTKDFNIKFLETKEVLFDEPEENIDREREKDFLRKLFLEKGLNVSSLDNFLECPWKYFFINLVSFPAVRDKYQLFGTAVHLSLESLIKKRKVEKDRLGFLIKSLEWNLLLQGLSEKDYKEYFEKGKKALTGFYENIFVNFPESIQSEVNIKGVKISEILTLGGRIDMLEKTGGRFIAASGEPRLWRVHDFKTGKPKSRNDINGSKPESRNNYLRQLVFYKLMLEKYKPGIIKVQSGTIDFVEPDSKGKYRTENFELTSENVDDLLNLLKSVADQIYNLTFWDDFCGDKRCEWCVLRRMMG